MSRVMTLLCLTLFCSALASAQSMQAIRPLEVKPAQPAPVVQPIRVTPADDSAAQATQAEPTVGPVQTVESLTAIVQKLRKENKQLRAENEALKARILGFTTPGGSEVRAYCPTETVSRNTAGGENDCATGGYKCDQVSGQCHTTCSTSAQCSGGYSCNPCNNRCETLAGLTQC
jgi:hypothetical protein